MRIAVVALAVLVFAGVQARAQTPPSSVAETDQIAAPDSAAAVSAGQITSPSGVAIVPSQLTRHALSADAPPSPSTRAQGRNTNVARRHRP